ncbi:MAG: CDP-alcohol phosphatidyltransferase family protein [Thermodesulfobacteriota bacterium]
MFSLPNLLSLFRIVSAPLLLLAAWYGRHGLFLLLFVAALVSDALDGFVARRCGQVTDLGGRLDSWGDFVLYCAAPPAIWWLWPGVIRQEWEWVLLALASFYLPVAIGFLRFRKLTSYHTWGSKAAAVALGMATPLLLVGGPAWPFRLAILILALSATEEVAITLVLPRLQDNLPSLRHAWRLRQEAGP